jgi:hypothetical protein
MYSCRLRAHICNFTIGLSLNHCVSQGSDPFPRGRTITRRRIWRLFWNHDAQGITLSPYTHEYIPGEERVNVFIFTRPNPLRLTAHVTVTVREVQTTSSLQIHVLQLAGEMQGEGTSNKNRISPSETSLCVYYDLRGQR